MLAEPMVGRVQYGVSKAHSNCGCSHGQHTIEKVSRPPLHQHRYQWSKVWIKYCCILLWDYVCEYKLERIISCRCHFSSHWNSCHLGCYRTCMHTCFLMEMIPVSRRKAMGIWGWWGVFFAWLGQVLTLQPSCDPGFCKLLITSHRMLCLAVIM